MNFGLTDKWWDTVLTDIGFTNFQTLLPLPSITLRPSAPVEQRRFHTG